MTAEIATSPEGAGFDTFDWRISMADVATDGPFSTFPGVDRTLVLIEGSAVELKIEGVARRLDPGSPFLSFPGEAATSARLPNGSIRDLNVMTRRARCRHAAEILAPAAKRASTRPAETIAVAALSGPLRIVVDGETYALDRLDVLIASRAPESVEVDLPALLIRLWPV